MKRVGGIVLVCLMLTTAVQAQSTPDKRNCGAGLPCGSIPWNLPLWPDLVSVTPLPEFASNPIIFSPTPTPTATSTPTPTATSTRTYTPTATGTAVFESDLIQEQIQTLEAVANGTDIPVENLQGTPVDLAEQVGQLSTNSATFWGYIKGLPLTFGDEIGALISFSFLAFGVVVGTKLMTIGLPILVAVWGVIRKIIQLILDFIPL